MPEESGEDPWAAIEDVLSLAGVHQQPGRNTVSVRKGNFDPLHLIAETSTLRECARVCCQHCSSSATPAAQTLSDALDTIREMYRKQLRKVPLSAPTGFIPESWRKLVLTPSGIDRKYYEFCVMNELKGALIPGDISGKRIAPLQKSDDYLVRC